MAIAGLLAVLCVPTGCGKPQASQPPPPPAVTVSQPLRREVIDWDEYTGHLQSPETANVAARVSGFIEQAPFKEGAFVHKGDLLFQIDDRPFKADLDNKQAAVAKDEAQMRLAEVQLRRSKQLIQTRVIAQQEYDTSKANYDQARAQLASDTAAAETSRLNLDWTRVTAPISGRISRMNVTVGNLVNGGAGQATVLTTIVSIDPMYCYVPVPEAAYLRYQALARKRKSTVRSEHIPCFIGLENETGFPHEGAIDFFDNSLDTTTGTIQVRGVIPNPSGVLTQGLFARMRVAGSDPYQTLLVPDAAVGAEQTDRYLLIVRADNVVESRPVKLGALLGSLRAIRQGLKSGEWVVVNGLQQARPGTKVAPVKAPVPAEAVAALEGPEARP